MKLIERACVLFTLWFVVTFGVSLFIPPLQVHASINSGFVSGAGSLTTTGAVPFQNGTAGQVTQSSTFTFVSPVLTVPALGSLKYATSCAIQDGSDGFLKFVNNAGTGACELIFGPGGGSVNDPAFVPVIQANPYILLRNAAGTGTTNLRIEAQKSTTGSRYVCIDTNGQLTSQAAVCSGT